VIVALCCTLVSCKSLVEKYKRSSSGVSELDKQVLYDFREPPIITPPGQLCPAAPANCSRPLSRAEGSFTYAAEQEQACLYQCAGSNRLEVRSKDNKVQASIETPYSAILKTFDLNHDDKNEFLFTVESDQGSVHSTEASLQTIEKGSLRAVENFGIVYSDPCSQSTGATEAKKNELIAKGLSPFIEAVRISYLPHPNHEMPSFTAERLRAECPSTPGGQHGPWRVVGK
jgi:hypothetical protein